MKINFLLPGYVRKPVGGFKVAFEYANRLAADGILVTIIYPVEIERQKVLIANLSLRWHMFKKSVSKRRGKRFSSSVWFPFHPAIREKLVPNLKEKFIPDADITFATAWETSVWLNTYETTKGRKFYLIQHYEKWNTTPEKVDESWRYPFTKIVIARWLQDHATTLGQHSILIYNGLNFEQYKIEKLVAQRNPAHVIMLYHPFEWKGSTIGIKALQMVKTNVPQLQVTIFSTYEQPPDLPDWVTFYRNPENLKDLYNEAAIFISPSQEEGWGLPPAEAMQCGCAVIATNVGGHLDYGQPDKHLLLVPPNNASAMAEAVYTLIVNNETRIKIALNGNAEIQQFTWDRAYAKFKKAILGNSCDS